MSNLGKSDSVTSQKGGESGLVSGQFIVATYPDKMSCHVMGFRFKGMDATFAHHYRHTL